MSDTRLLLGIVALLAVALIARRWPDRENLQQPPGRPWLFPLAAGVFTAALITWCWHGWNAPAVIDDEAAYLLQAQLFARGRWALPSPAAFEAFTQPAVLVTPVLAPKMAPGHALLLATGALLGIPGLIPAILGGLSAALLAVLARRLAGTGVAVVTVAIWLTQFGQLRWRASYFSEVTTALLWLLGWWALLRWRASGQLRWLLLLAVATGWGAITRPLTMIAFAIPVAAVVLFDVVRTRRWGQLAAALGAGTLVLMLLPLQNAEVLGDWRRSPLQLYTRQYLPFDRMGFSYDSAAPELTLPPTVRVAMQEFVLLHRAHRIAAVPAILLKRLGNAWAASFRGWRAILIPGAIAGLCIAGGSVWFGLASMLALYLSYLVYAHQPGWTVYYLEATPVPAFICATGLLWIVRRVAVRREVPLQLAFATAVLILIIAAPELQRVRDSRALEQLPFRRFANAAAANGTPRALVFIRYGPDHVPYVNLVRNVPNPETAPVLTALDAGETADRAVLARYPQRTGFIWDEVTGELRRL